MKIICESCGGKGRFEFVVDPNSAAVPFNVECTNCHGSGRATDSSADRHHIAHWKYVSGCQTPKDLEARLAAMQAENAELRAKVAGAIKAIKGCRFGGYETKVAWGPTPGVPDSYGYYWDGEYVGEIESLLLIAGKAS